MFPLLLLLLLCDNAWWFIIERGRGMKGAERQKEERLLGEKNIGTLMLKLWVVYSISRLSVAQQLKDPITDC